MERRGREGEGGGRGREEEGSGDEEVKEVVLVDRQNGISLFTAGGESTG